MNCSEALETLRRSEPDLRARGVRRAAVFGSVARGDGRPDSDIDILVEIDPDAHLTVVVAHKGKVVKSFAFVSVNETDVRGVVAELKKAVGK